MSAELIGLSSQVVEASKSSAEALGLELNEVRIIKLGGRSIQVMFTLNSYEGINE